MDTRGIRKSKRGSAKRAERAARILAGMCLVARQHRVVRCETRPTASMASVTVVVD